MSRRRLLLFKSCLKINVERQNGTIVQISSVIGVVPAGLQCAYTAAKAGRHRFHSLPDGTKSLFYNWKQIKKPIGF
ncbi:SDR family NAD(P)-dependent oxidoreductase [Acidobacterium sp. S8]|uniref:SDR family NAD(P)-dependent oxidoreductase n=1 Tax=Acidobacterium sp. S8 TaxID=1641854 RepID=UPI00131DFC50